MWIRSENKSPLPEVAGVGVNPRPYDAYILAAGRSTRMGTSKALLPHEGEDLLCAIARRYREAGTLTSWGLVDESCCELLYEHWIQNTPEWNPCDTFGDRGLILLTDVRPELPMMDSVRRAFRNAADRSVPEFFLQPVDAGVPSKEVLDDLLSKMGDALVVKPVHQGKGGHPLLISQRALEWMDWKQAISLREALQSLPEGTLRRVECDDPGVLRNWNRPQDIDRDRP